MRGSGEGKTARFYKRKSPKPRITRISSQEKNVVAIDGINYYCDDIFRKGISLAIGSTEEFKKAVDSEVSEFLNSKKPLRKRPVIIN
jgi:hypothetical protein